MGNLFRFVRQVDKPFRFDVELVGDTVFFVRKENDPKEIIEGVRGYGHTFPEAYTTWDEDVKGSETHQRVVRYKLGDLDCMVRFECDGYLPSNQKSTDSKSFQTSSVKDLVTALAGSEMCTKVYSPESALTINTGGFKIDQDSIFDLKTRSGRYRKEIDMQDVYPLLWLKQIPNFIIAYHDGAGLFEDIRVQNVKKDIDMWEKENKSAIRRLVILLRRIIEVARNNRNDVLEVYCPSVDVLEIRKQHGEGSHALPLVLATEWIGRKEASPDTSDAGGLYETDIDENDDLHESRHDIDNPDDGDDDDHDYTACDAECGYCGKCTY